MKVLIADDDRVSRLLMNRLLGSWGYTTVAAADGSAALRALVSPGAPELAVLDWMMPGMDGIEVARQIRAQSKDRYTYIVLVTARNTQADYLQALSAGADDLLTKPFDPQELKARLHVGQRILTLQSGLLQAVQATRFQAMHDALTGLPNRLSLLDTLAQEIARARRQKNALAVILADIDHFKRVNDTYGHLVGDDVLRALAKRMQRALRVYDTVGRLGGEEFLIVAPGATQQAGFDIAERVRIAVGERPVETTAGEIEVTISLGVSAAEGDANQALRAADAALYEAKNAGRNRTSVCTMEPTTLWLSGPACATQ